MIGPPLFFPSDRPSLRGAKLRTQHAANHIAEIETVVTQWATENSDTFVMTAPISQIAARGSHSELRLVTSNACTIHMGGDRYN